ncbi:uncharacterized protein LAJ45_09749 [Morchella importuna]|uniref:uncharacterized protein n=1 Tax=Morchella importuna TaxID=1174673 RepID=UPI001E8E3366|nr:uncharacterized protein LAJ45_09749 [Morchella importuna]KAH8146306.1 hypothetical protein LAJ45_09749 [Morchella importuna]
MRAKVKKDWEREWREEEYKMFPGRGREKSWVGPGEEVREEGEEQGKGRGRGRGRGELEEEKKRPTQEKKEGTVRFKGLQKKSGGGGGRGRK